MVVFSEKLYMLLFMWVFFFGWTQIIQTKTYVCSSFFLHFFGRKLKVYSSQAGALCCQLLFRTSCCEHSQIAFCLPCPSHASLMSGIKSWHFSLTSSHQYQYSRKETLISSCFPLRHRSYCFQSYCSNLLVISLHFGLWSSLCLWLCLSLTELVLSSLLIHVFCQSTDLKFLSQLVILCLDYGNVPSAGLGKCSHGLLISIQNDAANNFQSCCFVLSSLHLPVDITHELYLLVFELPCELFPPSLLMPFLRCRSVNTSLHHHFVIFFVKHPLFRSCFPQAW